MADGGVAVWLPKGWHTSFDGATRRCQTAMWKDRLRAPGALDRARTAEAAGTGDLGDFEHGLEAEHIGPGKMGSHG